MEPSEGHYNKGSQRPQHIYQAAHDTTNSTNFTGTCFDLEVRGGSTSQALSQSTVCGPLACGPAGQLQLRGRKRQRQESSWQDENCKRRPSTAYLTQDDSTECLDDCGGEEEVQSTYRAAAINHPASVKFTPSVPVTSQQTRLSPKLHMCKSTAQLTFPVQRRASAGTQHQASLCAHSLLWQTA